jgi:CcmD family protein
MENLGYLAAAYTIIFAVIFLYVLFLWRRQARLNTEMSALEAKIGELRTELDQQSPPPASRSAGH